MATKRVYHTATLLKTGKVLIVGGWDGSNTLASAELYDPATQTFAPTSGMITPRHSHTATLLADGRVLIAGGTGDYALGYPYGVPIFSAEIYDPATGTFTATGNVDPNGEPDASTSVRIWTFNWVFASSYELGVRPYWPGTIMRRHIRPAATRAGITKQIGWHTFRRATATLLLSTGASIRVTQELMRHASPVMTLGTYSRAITEDKLNAQETLAARLGIQVSTAEQTAA